jgi:hypothetical protein
MSQELMAAMQALERYGKEMEAMLDQIDDANFEGGDGVMQYVNQMAGALEGTGLAMEDLERFIQNEGPFYSKKGFMMAVQQALMMSLLEKYGYNPFAGQPGMQDMDFKVYQTAVYIVGRLEERFKNTEFNPEELGGYMNDLMPKLMDLGFSQEDLSKMVSSEEGPKTAEEFIRGMQMLVQMKLMGGMIPGMGGEHGQGGSKVDP